MPYCPACGFDSPSLDGRCAAGHPLPAGAARPEAGTEAEPIFDLPSEPLFESPEEPIFEAIEPLFDAPAPLFEAPAAAAAAAPASDSGASEAPGQSGAPTALEGASFTITLAPPRAARDDLPGSIEEEAPSAPRIGGSSRRIAIIGLALAVLAGAVGFVAFGRGGGGGRSLTRLFVPGETHRYLYETEIHGNSDVIAMSIDQDYVIRMELAEETLSVDPDGVATLRYTVDFADMTANGLSQPLGVQRGYSFTYRIGPDGRVRGTAGEQSQLTGDVAPIAGLFDLSSASPLLPEGRVGPGDSWTIEHELDAPMGQDPMEAVTEGTYLRDRDVAGQSATVIRSRTEVPLDFSIDFEKLFGSLDTEGTGLPDISFDLRQRIAGNATLRTTATLLKDTGRPIWVTGNATVDAKVSVSGGDLPSLPTGLGQSLQVDIEMSLRDLDFDEDVLRGGEPGSPASDVSSGAKTSFGKAVDRAQDAREAVERRQEEIENTAGQ